MTDPRPGQGGRLSALLALAALFVAGTGAGVALDRLVLLPATVEASPIRPSRGPGGPGAGPHSREDRQAAAQERFARALGLSAEQRVRVDSVMARQTRELRRARESLRPRVDSLLAETRRELERVLTPEQQQRLEQLREDRMFGRVPGDPGGRRP